jgi:hypothetical protein
MSLTIQTHLGSSLTTSQEPSTPKVTQFLRPLATIKNKYTDQFVDSLYAQMWRQREEETYYSRQKWTLKYTEFAQIGDKSVLVLTYKLPDGSIRHCFQRPTKMIFMLSSKEVLVVDEAINPTFCDRIK